eukprot:sb/3478868/
MSSYLLLCRLHQFIYIPKMSQKLCKLSLHHKNVTQYHIYSVPYSKDPILHKTHPVPKISSQDPASLHLLWFHVSMRGWWWIVDGLFRCLQCPHAPIV